MVDFSNALPLPIRKAALRVAGFTEAPFGEGFTVKWKSRPAVEWDKETTKEVAHA